MRSNRSFDTDTQRHCAARRPGDRAPRGAMPLRAGQLRRCAAQFRPEHRAVKAFPALLFEGEI